MLLKSSQTAEINFVTASVTVIIDNNECIKGVPHTNIKSAITCALINSVVEFMSIQCLLLMGV